MRVGWRCCWNGKHLKKTSIPPFRPYEAKIVGMMGRFLKELSVAIPTIRDQCQNGDMSEWLLFPAQSGFDAAITAFRKNQHGTCSSTTRPPPHYTVFYITYCDLFIYLLQTCWNIIIFSLHLQRLLVMFEVSTMDTAHCNQDNKEMTYCVMHHH